MAGKTKITKQFIISQTILYVFIMAFVITFKFIFGDKNILVGVMGITAILMLTQINLTVSPGKNLVKLIIINLGIGIFTYLANLNVWAAIPINFIGIFIIAYTFYYNLKTPVYLPFTLQYMFLLATPITAAELPMRLLSLLVAPIGIMLIQFVVNKNKTTKVGNKLIGGICDNIIKKINNDENKVEINEAIKKNANDFRKIIYDNRKDNFYVTEEGRIKLNIVIILEKLSNLLDEKTTNKQILNDLIICLQELKRSLGKEEDLRNITDITGNIINNYKKDNSYDLVSLKILNTINMLNISLKELKSLGKENYNTIKSSKDVPEKYKMINIHKREFYTSSVKFSYAIRVSLGITIAAFIADYFKLPEGRWIYFTAFAIIIPIYELSKKKLRDRMFATLVGGAIIVLSFTIFKNALIRMLIIMVAGYLRSYTSTYRYGTICTTICAIGAAAMTGGAVVLTIDRIVFVIFGTIIAIIINRFILPVRMKDANNELLGTYNEVVHGMLNKVYEEAINTGDNTHEMDTLLLVTTMIEERLAVNNGDSITEEYSSYFDKLRILIIDIYQLYTLVRINKAENSKVEYLIEDLKGLSNIDNIDINNKIKGVEEHIKIANGIDNKIIFASLRGVLTEIKELRGINKLLDKSAI
ncbi:FUSC family protein [uncultured Clostridium sp.]|uniref:FUSC family protein n=1 Tax=uncultured Clostridium sp. TaxID=59620 RepID=UPI0025DC0979|nr:FUSC family protein [uncultured Clostridium sp.]